MRSWPLVALLALAAAGCEEPEKADDPKAKTSPAFSRYAVIDVNECVEASSLGAGNARISDRHYGKPSVSAASVLGVSQNGECVVIARIARARDEGCRIDTQIHVAESDSKIIVVRKSRRRLTPVKKGGCSLDLANDPVAVQLRAPVGDRRIVDALATSCTTKYSRSCRK